MSDSQEAQNTDNEVIEQISLVVTRVGTMFLVTRREGEYDGKILSSPVYPTDEGFDHMSRMFAYTFLHGQNLAKEKGDD